MSFKSTYILLALITSFAFVSCENQSNTDTDQNSDTNDTTHLKDGKWMLYFSHQEGSIPVRFEVTDDSMTFYNSLEVIQVDDIQFDGDSIKFALPVFENLGRGKIHSSDSISGSWHRISSGPDYVIPFYAVHSTDAFEVMADESKSEPQRYDVTFFAPGYDPYPAIGQFKERNGHFTGTFLTEMGDSRFLQGQQTGDTFWMSAFDGGHLVYFEGSFSGDSVSGNFLAGKEWKETFKGVRDGDVTLTHPDSLTQATSENVQFTVTNLENQEITFDAEDFMGQVTIIQIMGSWCPNCLDETRFFKNLYARYNDKGLEIIPVAFERGETTEQRLNYLERHQNRLEIPYDVYLGGKADKDLALEKFPFLSNVSSFPTSIFIDKSGKIRKIHTGFYGPGTGDWYDKYTANTEAFVDELLSEEME